MPRKSRIVVPGAPHHVTQRGNRRQKVFFCDDDRISYLELLEHYSRKFNTYVLAYCLMDNHVHHLMVPNDPSGLRRVLQPAHMHYSQMINKKMDWAGHLWQQRFYSSVVSPEYFWIAMRYVERNPVEAKVVEHACDYHWSSAKAHCGQRKDSVLFYPASWERELRRINDWQSWLETQDSPEKISELKKCTAQDGICGKFSLETTRQNILD